jgi:hypothetical protein
VARVIQHLSDHTDQFTILTADKVAAPLAQQVDNHILDEIQNMSRSECRALLSRMGEGVKCFCLGDTRQVDHPYLNTENNGLNWIVNKFKGNRCYAHLVLKGDKSRGGPSPIW